MDKRRRTWLAVDVFYYRSKLAVGLRERFGVVGVVVFDAYLRTCKRNPAEGEMTYQSEEDFLSQIGLPGLDLRDEHGARWDLEALWTYLGRMKNVRRTRSGHVMNVRSTRWERWQNSRSRARNTGPLPTECADDVAPDRTGQRHDLDTDDDRTSSAYRDLSPLEAIPSDVWVLYAEREFEHKRSSVDSPVQWLAATQRQARIEKEQRALELIQDYHLSITELVAVLQSDSAPQWLSGRRRMGVS